MTIRQQILMVGGLIEHGPVDNVDLWLGDNYLMEFQDPKMEVLYHIFGHIFWGYPLHRPYIGLIYGKYLQFRFLKWPLNYS
jgi:hypothetical protein